MEENEESNVEIGEESGSDEVKGKNLKKMVQRLKYLLLQYRYHTDVDLRTVHSFYSTINLYVNDTVKNVQGEINKEDIEKEFWERADKVQTEFIKEWQDKENDSIRKALQKKDIVKFCDANFQRFPSDGQLNDQIDKYQTCVLGIINTLKESNDGIIGQREKIEFFHCLEKFSQKLLGAAMNMFWGFLLDIDSCQSTPMIIKTSNTPQVITMDQIAQFKDGKICLLCNNLKPRKEESTSDTLRQHLKNSHDILKLKCNLCGAAMTCTKNLKEHMKKVHKQAVFECKHKQCLEKFSTKAELQVHLEEDHKQKNIVFKGKDGYLARVDSLKKQKKSKASDSQELSEEIELQAAKTEGLSTNLNFNVVPSTSKSVDRQTSLQADSLPIRPNPTPVTQDRESQTTPLSNPFLTEEQLRNFSYEELIRRDLAWQVYVEKLRLGSSNPTEDVRPFIGNDNIESEIHDSIHDHQHGDPDEEDDLTANEDRNDSTQGDSHIFSQSHKLVSVESIENFKTLKMLESAEPKTDEHNECTNVSIPAPQSPNRIEHDQEALEFFPATPAVHITLDSSNSVVHDDLYVLHSPPIQQQIEAKKDGTTNGNQDIDTFVVTNEDNQPTKEGKNLDEDLQKNLLLSDDEITEPEYNGYDSDVNTEGVISEVLENINYENETNVDDGRVQDKDKVFEPDKSSFASQGRPIGLSKKRKPTTDKREKEQPSTSGSRKRRRTVPKFKGPSKARGNAKKK